MGGCYRGHTTEWFVGGHCLHPPRTVYDIRSIAPLGIPSMHLGIHPSNHPSRHSPQRTNLHSTVMRMWVVAVYVCGLAHEKCEYVTRMSLGCDSTTTNPHPHPPLAARHRLECPRKPSRTPSPGAVSSSYYSSCAGEWWWWWYTNGPRECTNTDRDADGDGGRGRKKSTPEYLNGRQEDEDEEDGHDKF